jgi:hypothetical protein
MKPFEAYKPDLAKTIAQTEQAYRDALAHRGGNVSFRALPPCDIAVYSRLDLTRYDFVRDIDQYADDLVRLTLEGLEERREIDDNMIASLSPVLGIGDYAAFVTGDIIFRPDTSWTLPCLKELKDYRNLPPLGTAPWYGRFLVICEAILKRIQGTGIPFSRENFSPLDLAHALRGEAIYYDFYDDPDGVHELLDYCAEATIRFAEDLYALVRKYMGNTPYGMFYLEGKINMSEDIACMISGDTYRELCAPHTQKVIDHFGVGFMHCHSRAMYLVKEICALNHVASLWLATDPNQPRPIEHVEELVKDAKGVSISLDCDRFVEIAANIGALRKGNFSVCLPVRDVSEGIRLAQAFKNL